MTSPAPNAAVPLLAARNISKSFPGVQALSDVQLSLSRGEVLCVVGENGAGKSTLMKILAGVEQPDQGEISLDGLPLRLASVDDAQQRGIVLIHQELNLAASLDVAANLYLGREPRWGGPLGLIDRRRIHADARRAMERVGLTCPANALVGSLSIGQQQLVEIARALCLKSRVLIMDEPTSSLTQSDSRRLLQLIRDLARDGVGVLYISHRLKEVEEIADRVVVLRDGRNAGDLSRAEISHQSLVRLMIGRELRQFFERNRAPQTTSPEAIPAASVADLRFAGNADHALSFHVGRGEVVGFAGLVGAGRTELAEALFGLRRIISGRVDVAGRPVELRTPRDAIGAGILLVPEDRRLQGLVLSDTVRRNISLASLGTLSRVALVRRNAERELAERMRRQLNIRTPNDRQVVRLLSGGNQQKVVLAKWLAHDPRLLILDEPTRGVDVGAKTEIYAIIDELAARGVGVLMISSDLEEILGVSDRVLVMHQGRLAGELARDELSEQAVMNLATGGERART